MFQIGDKVVHPMHGAGIVESIVQKKVDGVVRDYYIMKLPGRSMIVMIPTDSCDAIGVRPVMNREQADQVLDPYTMTEPGILGKSGKSVVDGLRIEYNREKMPVV